MDEEQQEEVWKKDVRELVSYVDRVITKDGSRGEALWMVGYPRLTGWGGCKVDVPVALELLKLAAAEGVLDAQLLLAATLEDDETVQADVPAAVQYYRMAAQQGSGDGCYGLAQYAETAGERWDLVRQAADFGHRRAQVAAGTGYLRGDDEFQPPDRNMAMHYLRLAADQDDDLAQHQLAILLLEDGDVREAVELLKLASRSEKENSDAQFYLASLYESGRLGDINLSEAKRLYETATNLGHRHARLALAAIYERQHNYLQAARLYQQAEDDGDRDAVAALARVREKAGVDLINHDLVFDRPDLLPGDDDLNDPLALNSSILAVSDDHHHPDESDPPGGSFEDKDAAAPVSSSSSSLKRNSAGSETSFADLVKDLHDALRASQDEDPSSSDPPLPQPPPNDFN